MQEIENTPSQPGPKASPDSQPETAAQRWKERRAAGKRAYEEARFREAEQEYKASLEAADAFGYKDPRFAATLNELAEVYRAQGRYDEAEPLFLHALALSEEALGPGDIQVAHTLNNLAALHAAQKRFEEAEKNYQRAIEIEESVLGPEDFSLGASLNNLALLYKTQSKFDDALPLFERALRIWIKLFGAEHPYVATTLNNLGTICQAEGKSGEAESLLKQALAIKEKALGPKHPDVATISNNLADLYCDQGRYADARVLFERVLEIDQAAWGPTHPEVAADLNQLGRALEAEGDYAKAEACYLRALEIRETTPGTKHEQIAKCLDKLAALCRTQGRQDEANAFAQRAAAIRAGASGAFPAPRQPSPKAEKLETAPAKQEQQILEPPLQAPARAEGPASGKPAIFQSPSPAQEKISRRSPEIAAAPDSAAQRPGEAAMKRMILLPASQMGLNHPEAAQNLSELAERYTRERRFAEAEKLYEGALDIERSVSGARDAGGGATLSNLGCVHFAEGHLEKAAALFQESLGVWLKCLGPEHPFVAAPLNNLAAVCVERRGSLEAEALYKRALKISEPPSGVRDNHLPVILANLTELYSAQGRHQEAAALVEKFRPS